MNAQDVLFACAAGFAAVVAALRATQWRDPRTRALTIAIAALALYSADWIGDEYPAPLRVPPSEADLLRYALVVTACIGITAHLTRAMGQHKLTRPAYVSLGIGVVVGIAYALLRSLHTWHGWGSLLAITVAAIAMATNTAVFAVTIPALRLRTLTGFERTALSLLFASALISLLAAAHRLWAQFNPNDANTVHHGYFHDLIPASLPTILSAFAYTAFAAIGYWARRQEHAREGIPETTVRSTR
ncbi:hypothetical protein GPX89_28450 [Nocardia sp. ET3-3]|uniref:Uncharacterized protein n=1 Tax=Nocardia terrae TaxID=2675851 RepID=A0A7K1V3E8_9NOCA|nr:hypothetical protein [Nocardia terrae]MVU81163.1 hypothetical protein [Nocardia terrae]